MSHLITRRQTLQSLATAAAFGSGLGGMVLSLAGCGGHGGGGKSGGGGAIALRTSTVKAKVVLPAGTSVAPSALRVSTVGGTDAPNAAGEVNVTIVNGGPQYAEARDAQGNLVVAGFVTKDQTVLDAASTAQVIACLGLGVAGITGEARPKVLASLRTAAGFNELAAAVADGIRSSGKTTFGAAALEARLDAMWASAGGRTRAAGGSSGGSTRGTNVEPTTNPSGIAVDTSVDGELKLKNVRLRRAIGWLDTVSHQVQVGKTVTTVPAVGGKATKPILIGSPKRFAGTIGTIKDALDSLVTGAAATYAPVEVGPFPIPAVAPKVAGSIATEYRLSLAGPGLTAGDRAKIEGSRDPFIQRTIFDGFLLDYFLPFFTAVLIPFTGDELDSFLNLANGNAVFGDFLNTVLNTAPGVYALMEKGEYYDALIALRDAGLLAGTFLPLMTQFFLKWIEKYGSDKLYDQAGNFADRATQIFGQIGAIDKWGSALETFVATADFLRSNRGDVLTITSTGGKVTLQAAKPSLPANETTSITATIQNKNPDAAYKYEWTVGSAFRLNDSFGKSTDDSPGGVLTTSRDSVAILSKDLKPGVATVMCRVTRIDGANDVPVGTGEVAVTFDDSTPVDPRFSYYADQGGVVLYASVAVPRTEGALRYRLLRDGGDYKTFRAELLGVNQSDIHFVGDDELFNLIGYRYAAPYYGPGEPAFDAKYAAFQAQVLRYKYSIKPLFTDDDE